jgi:hypothetical protein
MLASRMEIPGVYGTIAVVQGSVDLEGNFTWDRSSFLSEGSEMVSICLYLQLPVL